MVKLRDSYKSAARRRAGTATPLFFPQNLISIFFWISARSFKERLREILTRCHRVSKSPRWSTLELRQLHFLDEKPLMVVSGFLAFKGSPLIRSSIIATPANAGCQRRRCGPRPSDGLSFRYMLRLGSVRQRISQNTGSGVFSPKKDGREISQRKNSHGASV